MMPEISCIMSNYNTDPMMFRASLDSILDQTFRNFELILIDDKSTNEDSKKVIDEYCQKDSRIVAVYNEENKGLAGSLNKGLKIARGKFIARFDTDDLCVKDRFERQMVYMEQKHIDICSTFAHLFGEYDRVVSTSFISNEEVAAQLLFSCYIYHTPVMMRRSFLKEHELCYDVTFDGVEDFDLFSRCREAGGKICIMPEVMFHYRLHSNSICHTQNTKQARLSSEICRRQLGNMEIKYSQEEWRCHQVLCGLDNYTPELRIPLDNWCRKLIRINEKKAFFDKKTFTEVVYNRLLTAVMKADIGTGKKAATIIKNQKLFSLANIDSILYRTAYALRYKLRSQQKNVY